MNIITKSEDEAKGIAGESMHRKKGVTCDLNCFEFIFGQRLRVLSTEGNTRYKVPSKEPHEVLVSSFIKPGACESAHTLITPGEFMGYKPGAGLSQETESSADDIPKQRRHNINSRSAN